MFSVILSAVDFSDGSRVALRRAASLAGRLGARLLVVAVNEPLLAQAADLAYSPDFLRELTERDLREFVNAAGLGPDVGAPEIIVTAGKPADAILAVARDRGADLVVLGTHGLSGYRKLFFGSVTESVLRQTECPVLAVPHSAGERVVGEATPVVLVPLELDASSESDARAASRVAATLGASLLLAHVVHRARGRQELAADLERHHAIAVQQAKGRLEAIMRELGDATKVEIAVRVGDPAEEIATLAGERGADPIVMGLRRGGVLGPRPGSIAYRVLCLSRAAVLALPRARTDAS